METQEVKAPEEDNISVEERIIVNKKKIREQIANKTCKDRSPRKEYSS